MPRPWSGIHRYAIYELLGIPRERWLNCVAWQTTADYHERAQIQRYLSRRDQPRR
jgi:hypothetical protein